MDTDVCIIGAGPGGLRAAWECARNGLSTLVLDKKRVVGRPVHCGECLSTAAVQNTGLNLPDEVIAKAVRGVRLNFPDGSRRRLIESGFVLNKDRFEQWLADNAVQSGSRIQLNHEVTGLKLRGDGWQIDTRQGASYHAGLLLDASGVHSIANKRLALNPPFRTVIGLQYTLEGSQPSAYIDFYLWPRLAPKGYLWMIPKGGRVCNIGLVTSNASAAKAQLDQFIDQLGLKNLKRIRTMGGRIPVSGPLPVTFADRLLIIGDAAGFTNPIFKGGTHLALKSGCLAASIAIDAIKQHHLGTRQLARYQRLWRRHFPNYNLLDDGRRHLNAFPEARLNLLARYMPDNVENFSLNQIIWTGLKILFNHPGLLVRGGPQVMRAFKYSRARWYGW